MMGCVISPLLYVLVIEMMLLSASVNTNQITAPSMKASMDDVTLIAESRSHMEQLQTKTKTLVNKFERILIKLYRQNVSLLFNQTHTHIYIYIYIYIHAHTYTRVS